LKNLKRYLKISRNGRKIVKKFKTVTLVIGLVSCCALALTGCKDPSSNYEKINFEYGMSAVTTAIERSYAKATGQTPSAVLDSVALDTIPDKCDFSEDTLDYPIEELYLYSVQITGLTEFKVNGDFDDAVKEYCGAGEYQVLIAEYIPTFRTVYMTKGSDHGVVVNYGYQIGTANRYLIVEGINGGKMFCGANGVRFSYDSNNQWLSSDYEFSLFSYADKLDNKVISTYPDGKSDWEGTVDNDDYKRPEKHTINVNINSSDTATFVYCNDGGKIDGLGGYIHEYEFISNSFHTYVVDDIYTVAELVLPVWYQENELT